MFETECKLSCCFCDLIMGSLSARVGCDFELLNKINLFEVYDLYPGCCKDKLLRSNILWTRLLFCDPNLHPACSFALNLWPLQGLLYHY